MYIKVEHGYGKFTGYPTLPVNGNFGLTGPAGLHLRYFKVKAM